MWTIAGFATGGVALVAVIVALADRYARASRRLGEAKGEVALARAELAAARAERDRAHALVQTFGLEAVPPDAAERVRRAWTSDGAAGADAAAVTDPEHLRPAVPGEAALGAEREDGGRDDR